MRNSTSVTCACRHKRGPKKKKGRGGNKKNKGKKRRGGGGGKPKRPKGKGGGKKKRGGGGKKKGGRGGGTFGTFMKTYGGFADEGNEGAQPCCNGSVCGARPARGTASAPLKPAL